MNNLTVMKKTIIAGIVLAFCFLLLLRSMLIPAI
jgi:hypothetical protein